TKDGGKNIIEIKDGKVRMAYANCPYKLCVKQGWIRKGAIICLPHKVFVIVGGKHREEPYDAITR
ncbi:MAG: NusG domain II-containing protein, partial [Nitrospirae bacterium]